MKTKLDQLPGPLNPTKIAAGMNLANKNAKRLLADAKISYFLPCVTETGDY